MGNDLQPQEPETEISLTRIIDSGLPDPQPFPTGSQFLHVPDVRTLRNSSTTGIRSLSFTGQLGASDLSYIAKEFGPNLEVLILAPQTEGCPGGSKICFSSLSHGEGADFPRLHSLIIQNQLLERVHLSAETFPALRRVEIQQGCVPVKSWFSDLPEMETVKLEFFDIEDSSGFVPSMERSPKLKHLVAYKFFGLATFSETAPVTLRHPSLTHLALVRSDDLDYLALDTPKLERLNLRCCFQLRSLQILDASSSSDPSQFDLVLVNARPDVLASGAASHPRCKQVISEDDTSRLGRMELKLRQGHMEGGVWGSPSAAAKLVHVLYEPESERLVAHELRSITHMQRPSNKILKDTTGGRQLGENGAQVYMDFTKLYRNS